MNGVSASIMTGLTHFLWQNESIDFLMIPVDLVSNCAIASAFSRAIHPSDNVFFNISPSQSNSMTFGQCKKYFNEIVTSFPPADKLFWYPYYQTISNFLLFALMFLLFELFPAALVDLYTKISGKKAL
jgi:hypothetical protein